MLCLAYQTQFFPLDLRALLTLYFSLDETIDTGYLEWDAAKPLLLCILSDRLFIMMGIVPRLTLHTARSWSKWGALLALALGGGSILGQPLDVSTRYACDTLILQPGDTATLSHSFWVPGSDTVWQLPDVPLPEGIYQIAYDKGQIWAPTMRKALTLRVAYRYFTQPPPEQIALRELTSVLDTATRNLPTTVQVEEPKGGSRILWEENGGLRKSGSLSTGLNAGNNRSPSITSGLRLRLAGDLGDGLQVTGALTDENLPIQPDGTTQQISDFDKVFVQLSKGPYAVTVGDYEVSRKGSRFSNYYRNVQGLQLEHQTSQHRLRLSGAVAKGEFFTNSFMGRDGISGPYRLRGKTGEQFFIVLAGSEQVYLNGRRMKRGEAHDYVMNYNTAEITFTARHVITNVTRIVVDFEYVAQQFNRSLLVGEWQQRALNDRLSVELSYARDADNPNAPFSDPTLYNLVRDSLAQIGDTTGAVNTSGVFLVGYQEGELRYEARDTLVNGQSFIYYQRSLSPERAVYQVIFSRVGLGQGSYRRDDTDNEFVYQWVGPDSTGQLQGDYEPVRRWNLPRMLQVMSGNASFQLDSHWQVYTETALSLEDENRLSSLDDGDNMGIATRTGIKGEQLSLGDSLMLAVEGFYQLVSQRYTNLDRVYAAEYNRRWNLDAQEARTDEQILGSKTQLTWRNQLSLQVEAGLRLTGSGKRDWRQVYTLSSRLPNFLQGDLTYTRIDNQRDSIGMHTRWNRYEGDVFAQLGKKWRTGVEIWIEDQQRQLGDSIVGGAFSFVDLTPYVKAIDMEAIQLKASFNYRRDCTLVDQQWREKSRAYTAYLEANVRPTRGITLQQLTSYRVLDVRDSIFDTTEGLADTRVLSTNWQLNVSPRKRWISSQWVYEVSSEQLARQTTRYIEVAPGQGTHIWLDSLFNQDGIQDIEEFQVATNPLVADFIRVLVPTDELVPTTRLGLTGSLRLLPEAFFPRPTQWWEKAIRGIQPVTTLRMSQHKSRNTALGSYWISIRNPFADTTLLNASYTFRQDIFFFQTSKIGSLQANYTDNQVQLYLSTGSERRGQQAYGLIGRLNLGGDISNSRSLEVTARQGTKELQAELGRARNYDIGFQEIAPRINLQLGSKLRVSGGYTWLGQQNRDSLEQVAARTNAHKLIVEGRWNLKGFNNLNSRLELVYLTETGTADFGAQYELREGLQPGGNAVWQLLATFRLLQNVELSITYDGRLSVVAPIVHTGRVQVRAFF